MMSRNCGWNVLGLLAATVMLNGCVSMVFPDFEDDGEIVITDGGKVEVREVNEDGILVGDKENAAYEDDEEYADAIIRPVEEKVEPAKVVEVVSSDIDGNVEVADKKIEENANVAEKADEILAEVAVGDEAEVKVQEEKGFEPTVQYLAATIHFDNGGAVISSEYNKILREIARLVKENDAHVLVYGFASSRTRDTDPASHKLANFKVSAERAENTAKALRRFGVPANKIMTQAMSDSMPMYQEVMPEGERLNRRAEIYLAY